MYRALLLSSSLLIVMSSPQFHTHHGRRVCQRDVRHNVVMVTESYVQPVHKPYITVCQGHRLCSTYKTTYSLAYRQVSRTVSTSHSVPECCPGWRRLHSTNCNQAVCRHLCINGGTCQRPNLCACPPGWTGDRCQTDVDECSGKHPCVQRCVNTAGSYRCACGDGFRLLLADTGPSASPAGGQVALVENVTEEVKSLRSRVELLEKVLIHVFITNSLQSSSTTSTQHLIMSKFLSELNLSETVLLLYDKSQ
uniref:EGF-like-domain, multiple 7 n=1 Tax=Oryzias sinensis TaxID=183150 RepID=A0A8C7XBR6_9TELE